MTDAPYDSLGFRHVVEDGLALLQTRPLPPGRRDYVLAVLVKLLNDAERGRTLMKEQRLVVGTPDREAFDAYCLLDQLCEDGWRDALEPSQDALRRLVDGDAAPAERSAAIGLFAGLLKGLEQSR